MTKGFCGKVTDVSDFMAVRHRTNLGNFFISESMGRKVCWERSKKTCDYESMGDV